MNQLTKEEFIKLYKELSLDEMSKKCEVSKQTISNWARKFNLQGQKRPSLIKREYM